MLKTYPYEILLKRNYEDFNKCFDRFKAVLKVAKEENDKDFLLEELKTLYEVQGSENFKKITGFNYEDLDDNNIKTMDDLLRLIQAKILLYGKSAFVRKSGLTMPTINRFFNNKDVSAKTLFKVIDCLGIRFKVVS